LDYMERKDFESYRKVVKSLGLMRWFTVKIEWGLDGIDTHKILSNTNWWKITILSQMFTRMRLKVYQTP
jgi:hypothetical protein